MPATSRWLHRPAVQAGPDGRFEPWREWSVPGKGEIEVADVPVPGFPLLRVIKPLAELSAASGCRFRKPGQGRAGCGGHGIVLQAELAGKRVQHPENVADEGQVHGGGPCGGSLHRGAGGRAWGGERVFRGRGGDGSQRAVGKINQEVQGEFGGAANGGPGSVPGETVRG